MAEKDNLHRTTIGGQALIEGIMMKGPEKTAMAVRRKDGEIVLEEKENKQRKWYNKAPFIRGTINFVSQLSDGYYSLKYVNECGNETWYHYNSLLLLKERKEELRQEALRLKAEFAG